MIVAVAVDVADGTSDSKTMAAVGNFLHANCEACVGEAYFLSAVLVPTWSRQFQPGKHNVTVCENLPRCSTARTPVIT